MPSRVTAVDTIESPLQIHPTKTDSSRAKAAKATSTKAAKVSSTTAVKTSSIQAAEKEETAGQPSSLNWKRNGAEESAPQRSESAEVRTVIDGKIRVAAPSQGGVEPSDRQQQAIAPSVRGPGIAPEPVGDQPPVQEQPVPKAAPLTGPIPSLKYRPAVVLESAMELFPRCGKWVVFYREILGTEGIARQLFPTSEQMRYWEESKEFGKVMEMLAALRATDTEKADSMEPQRMITLRIPSSLNATLKKEAKEYGTSVNKLSISKLINGISPRFVPRELKGIPGRRTVDEKPCGKFPS